jgi:hypothetical protein
MKNKTKPAMKILSSRMHGFLDYVTVIFLLLTPYLFGFNGLVAYFTLSLGIVHLVLTLFTNFEWGLFRIVPLRIHGAIELAVSVLLLGVAFWFRATVDYTSFVFYIVFAAVLFIVWLISDYQVRSYDHV